MNVFILFSMFGIIVLSSAKIYSEEEKDNDHDSYAVIPDVQGGPHLVNLRPKKGPKLYENVTLDDFNVYFYSPDDPEVGIKLSPHEFNGTIPSDGFDPDLKTIFVSAGWIGSNTSGTPDRIREEVIEHGGANIFVLDWSRVSSEFYTVVVLSIPKLGIICGNFIDKILEENEMNATQIMLIGESVGAHLVGACGSAMQQRPGTILGLDPAQPLFYVDEPDKRLSTDDGDVVHVLHTNRGFTGFLSSIGHADYFANGGGMKQPGCGMDIFGICAHHRAPAYYEESINSGGFLSLKCENFQDFKNGTCDDNDISYFGGIDLDPEAEGNYYFNTNAESPFSLD